MKLEKMDEFFNSRVDIYDKHMIDEVSGCKNGYKKIATLIPNGTKTILDLGCGTGLELDEYLKSHDGVQVTGIDMSEEMLKKFKAKHYYSDLNLICDNYLEYYLGEDKYDIALSFQTMHHLNDEQKISLYKRIYTAVKDGGCYIEGDYMLESGKVQDCLKIEGEKARKENNLTENDMVHIDIPNTIHVQRSMLKKAGFKMSELVFKEDNTAIIVAYK